MNIKEEFQVHETLNPKLWSSDNHLLPEVREKIIEIVANFEHYIEVPIYIVDVQLVGSNASFNYTDKSDLDVHIIANFDLVNASPELLQAIYNMKKTSFNRTYDISIHGVDIEMYVQDVKSNVVSNGIYSVCDDAWVKEPKPIKSITKHNTEKEVEKWTEHINSVLERNSYEEIANTLNTIYLMRKNSIAVDGEYGKGNAIFKDMRNLGLIEKLKDALDAAFSKKLSLEELSKGQLVNSDID